jgi:AraC-like DNA-binding protein
LANRQYHLSNCFINGFNSRPIENQLPKKQLFFGILFQPLAVKKVLRTPAREFSDIAVDCTLIDPVFNSLWQQLAEQTDFNKRVNIVLAWLSKYVEDPQPQEQLINGFLHAGNYQNLSVTELAGSVCYSARHTSRKLYEATGLNAEEMLLYKKYLRAVDLLHGSQLSLTEIAYHCNFSDQSHFIKTFKRYTGLTPGAYRQNMSGLKCHLFQNVR